MTPHRPIVRPLETIDYAVTLVTTDRGDARRVSCKHCGYSAQKWRTFKAIEAYETHWRVRHPDVVEQRVKDQLTPAFHA